MAVTFFGLFIGYKNLQAFEKPKIDSFEVTLEVLKIIKKIPKRVL